ncbi:hypothetical protein, partial [Bacillus wiedmannii]|uniref:hypothetical protein n=1 Tax=Bacillus wiedmannii TaxID=1890302 RepID=UPI00352AA157
MFIGKVIFYSLVYFHRLIRKTAAIAVVFLIRDTAHTHQPKRTGYPKNDKNELHYYKRHNFFVFGVLQNFRLMDVGYHPIAIKL